MNWALHCHLDKNVIFPLTARVSVFSFTRELHMSLHVMDVTEYYGARPLGKRNFTFSADFVSYSSAPVEEVRQSLVQQDIKWLILMLYPIKLLGTRLL